eukprot:15462522-Alexandrium_andersonii.AAC.1
MRPCASTAPRLAPPTPLGGPWPSEPIFGAAIVRRGPQDGACPIPGSPARPPRAALPGLG